MHDQDLEQHPSRTVPARPGHPLHRRAMLKGLAGGAIAGALVLAGCQAETTTPPVPVATSTPTPWVSPSPEP